MGTEYDSVKIRRLAGQIGGIADAVFEVRDQSLKSIQREIPTNFRGEAANALQDATEDLSADVNALGQELRAIRNALIALAQRVEEADRQAKLVINKK